MAKRFSTRIWAMGGVSSWVLLAATPVMAADTAGEAAATSGPCRAVETQFVCAPQDGPFNAGISYAAPTGDLRVTLTRDLVVAPDQNYTGVYVQADDGDATIEGAGAAVVTLDAGGAGGFARGDLVLTLGTVTSVASQTESSVVGIDTFAFGDTTITAGTVATTGDYSHGIRAQSTSGTIAIRADEVSTSGYSSDAVQAFAGNDVTIDIGAIRSTGDYNFGVNVMNGNVVDEAVIFGNTQVATGDIAIVGDDTAGIAITTYGDADVTTGDIALTGDTGGTGIYMTGLGNFTVSSGDIRTTGVGGVGVNMQSLGGAANVIVGDVTATRGGGVYVNAEEGNSSVVAGDILAGGEQQIGLGASSKFGNLSILVGDVTAKGAFGGGISGEAYYGTLTATAGSVGTEGDVSHAIRLFGGSTDLRVTGSLSTTGYSAIGLLNATTLGDAYAQIAGSITTSGDFAQGAWVTSRYGTGTTRFAGPVTTTGYRAHGVHVAAEDGQLNSVIGTVTTSGEMSDGVHARTSYVEIYIGQRTPPEGFTFTGDISLEVGNAAVTGLASKAVSARGLGAADLAIGSASSRSDYAIEADMIGNVDLALSGIAKSEAETAVFLRGDDITVALAATASIAGAKGGLVIDALGERCVMRNPEDGVTPNPCPNPGDDFLFTVDPTPSPDPVDGIGGTVFVSNRGSISGGSGHAVEVRHGTAVIDNLGVIEGRVLFGAGDDLVNNAGRFVVTGSSQFGAGVDGFVNTGMVSLGAATMPASYALQGLESFANRAVVSLANGVAGDTLRIGGDYSGANGATLVLEAAGSATDTLVIDGQASGTTQIVLAPGFASGISGPEGRTLVDAGANSDATAFTLAGQSANTGFIRNAIVFSGGDFRLVGRAAAGTLRQLAFIEGVEDASAFVLGGWRARIRAARDEAPEAGSRLWGSLETGRSDHDRPLAAIAGEEALLGYRNRGTGGQIGYDIATAGEGALRLGVLGRYTDSRIDFAAAGEGGDVATLGGGVYGSYAGERMVASALVRYDHHAIDTRLAWSPDTFASTASTLAADAEIGLRIAGARFFAEPRIGLGWNRTSLGDLVANGQRLAFEAANGLRGRSGVRFGTMAGDAQTMRLYGDLGAVHAFGTDYRAVLTAGGSERIELSRAKTYAEGTLGIDWRSPNGFGLFAEAEGETGSGRESLAGRVGLRLAL